MNEILNYLKKHGKKLDAEIAVGELVLAYCRLRLAPIREYIWYATIANSEA